MRICPQCETKTTAETCPQDGYPTVDAARFTNKRRDGLIGTVFLDRYRLDALLGRGGMGAVYKATQLAVGRPVALKILKTELAGDLKEVARFQQEARAIAALQHPNTIRLYDFGSADDGTLFLVMEYLEGLPLSELIKREAPLDPKRVVHIGIQVLEALAEAHNHGIVHRDLKPENVFLTTVFGKSDFVKLLDFGIAKLVGDNAPDANLTQTGMFVGSPRYMAPEQVRSQWVSDRTDIYALGAILYEMLTGQPVFQASTPTGYLIAHVQEMPDPPTRSGTVLAGPLVDFIMQCLEKAPEDRPAGALDGVKVLQACAAQPLVTGAAVEGDGADAPGAAAGEVGPQTRVMQRDIEVHTISGERTDRPDHPAAVSTGLARSSMDELAAQHALEIVQGSTTVARSAPKHERKRSWLPIAALLGAAAVGAGAWFASRAPASPTQAPPTVATEAPPSAASPTATAAAAPAQPATPPTEAPTAALNAEPAAAAEPAATAETQPAQAGAEIDGAQAPAGEAPAAPAVIRVTVVSDPTGATVKRGDETLGKTPFEATWSEGETAPALVLALDGHKDAPVDLSGVEPGASHSVQLTPEPRKPSGKSGKSGKSGGKSKYQMF